MPPVDALTPYGRYLLSNKRPFKLIEMPGCPGLMAALVNPSDAELADAQIDALAWLRKGRKLDEYDLALSIGTTLFQAEEARQILYRALRNPDNIDLSFCTLQELRDGLNVESRNVLMRILNDYKEERSPETVLDVYGSPESVVSLMRDLKAEAGLSRYLPRCSFATLVYISTSLAAALSPNATQPLS